MQYTFKPKQYRKVVVEPLLVIFEKLSALELSEAERKEVNGVIAHSSENVQLFDEVVVLAETITIEGEDLSNILSTHAVMEKLYEQLSSEILARVQS